MTFARKLWRWSRDWLPTAGFHFDQPLVILQSDDWGRVGLRDRSGFERLRSEGLALGERSYDLYSLETAGDLSALSEVLKRHRDSSGRHACMQMNFILANLDFARMSVEGFREIHLLPLTEGLPQGWERPGLLEGYRQGISEGVFYPALHGTTHFCRSAVERNLAGDGERTQFLLKLWRAGTPYIHWRMPWVGYEYWDPEKPDDERFLPECMQQELIGQAFGLFAKMFSSLPRSACAPGYRANYDTNRAWAQHGIRVAQGGPGAVLPPHFDRYGLLHLSRTVEFEPAVDAEFSVEGCLRRAENSFERGLPAIVSVHAINFHSTVRDFRTRSLQVLDEFLTALESNHSDLLYLHDEDVHELVTKGSYHAPQGDVRVNVTRTNFIRAHASVRGKT